MELYDLLVRAKKNDKDAMYEIIEDFSLTLKKLSKGLHYEEAETDLIIELIELIQNINLEKFLNSNNKQIAKYIHLRKRSINLFKKHKKPFDTSLEINHEILQDDSLEYVENTVVTSMIIESLVKKQKDIITMEFVHGYSEKDISKILGISRQAVNRTKNRALNNLRKIVIKNGGDSVGRKSDRVSFKSGDMDSSYGSTNILYFEKPRKKGFTARRERV